MTRAREDGVVVASILGALMLLIILVGLVR